MISYHGQSDVAQWCGVTRAAVSNWINRHDDYPEPDVIILNEETSGVTVTRGWLAGRRPEWERFAAERKQGRKTTETIEVDPAELLPGDIVVGVSDCDLAGYRRYVRVLAERTKE